MVSPYNASKHAIEAIGDSLRQELRPLGVEVSLVEPGSVKTPIWDKAGAGGPEARAGLSEDVDRMYGPMIDRVQKLASETGERGIAPEKVAEVVQARAGGLLPDRALDAVVARMLRD